MTVWVLAADAFRARFFEASSRTGPLQEVKDLVHPASRSKEQELVSDGAGRGRSGPGPGGPGHSVGHEDDAKRAEAERFAREVAKALTGAREKERFERLHVLAAPHFLGLLRDAMDAATRKRIAGEHALNVTTLDAEAIRSRLPEHL